MACEQNANKVSRLICLGLTHLASKRGFYAGLAVGSAGAAGLARLLARRLSDPRLKKRQPEPAPAATPPPGVIGARQLPQLQARPKITPAPKVAAAERCVTCRTPGGSKPGAWYTIGPKVYCPDCAPDAAQRSGVDLITPVQPVTSIVISGVKGAGGAGMSSRGSPPQTPPVISGAAPQLLPLKNKIKSTWAPAPLRICLTRRALGADQDSDIIVNSGYVVLRAADHGDTGLAVTPAIILPSKPGEPALEDTGQWHVLHINSGTVLTGQTFSTPEQAQLLADILAQLDWTKEEEEILRTFNLEKINATISMVTPLIKSQRDKATQAGPAGSSPPTPAAVVSVASSISPGALAGRIMADRYGGIGRVIGEDKDTLLMIDTLGERYEIDRDAVWEPSEADYNLVRVAQRIDPARRPGETCSNCDRPTGAAAPGEVWYRMKLKSFCPACARVYAQEQAFELEENVGGEPS